jgi:hypothetical protein
LFGRADLRRSYAINSLARCSQQSSFKPGHGRRQRGQDVAAMSRLFYPQKDDEAEIVTADDGMVHISPF